MYRNTSRISRLLVRTHVVGEPLRSGRAVEIYIDVYSVKRHERQIGVCGDAGIDPWGRAYSYQSWADSFAIRSFGPDGEIGNEDDLRVSKRRPF